ncbi:MAG: M28 family peptidase [Acidobacteria bacterium]|nr:M28 family peptidase [Acidobacteriota bacterium]
MAPERFLPTALRILPALMTLLAAGPLGAGGDTGPPPKDPPLDRPLAAAVVAARAVTGVRDLVAFGPRMGGTSSGDRAAAYLRGRFEALGLTVVETVEPEKPTHEERSFEATLLEPGAAPLDAWPVGFSPSLPSAELLVHRSAGGVPKGAWALLSDEVPDAAARRAAEAGATAVLTDAPREEGRYLDWAPAEELGASAPRTVPVFTLSLNSGKKVRRALDAGGAVKVRLSLDARTAPGRPRSILATLPGDLPGWYLVCAHGDSDSGGPGADDNASGVASALEVATSLAAAARAGLLPKPRPSVRFAIWGSEIHSSRAFVTERAPEIESLLGVFNFDQTAAATERHAIYFEGNDVPWNGPLLRTLLSAAKALAGRDGFPGEHTTNPSLGGTDAEIFLPKEAHGAGLTSARVPVTTVFTAAWGSPEEVPQTPGWDSDAWPQKGIVRIDYSPVYHSSGDTPSAATDHRGDNMAACARVVAVALGRLMSPPASGEAPSQRR